MGLEDRFGLGFLLDTGPVEKLLLDVHFREHHIRLELVGVLVPPHCLLNDRILVSLPDHVDYLALAEEMWMDALRHAGPLPYRFQCYPESRVGIGVQPRAHEDVRPGLVRIEGIIHPPPDEVLTAQGHADIPLSLGLRIQKGNPAIFIFDLDTDPPKPCQLADPRSALEQDREQGTLSRVGAGPDHRSEVLFRERLQLLDKVAKGVLGVRTAARALRLLDRLDALVHLADGRHSSVICFRQWQSKNLLTWERSPDSPRSTRRRSARYFQIRSSSAEMTFVDRDFEKIRSIYS